ncbi:MAG: hypothetical protein ACXVCY_04455 [Pseudobdellovibrionaceae bacterium]
MSESKIEISDPWLGKRVLGPGKASIIKDQLNLLNHYKNDGRVPSQHLLDDIAVYEFILKQDDPEKYANDYLAEAHRLRTLRNSNSIKKMDVAKSLGWEIYG